jgi:hypothetical protein
MEDIHLLEEVDSTPSSCRQINFYSKRDPIVEYNDQQFRRTFRMSKESFCRLHEIVSPLLPRTPDPRATSTEMQLLIALRFYAVDTFHYVTVTCLVILPAMSL